MNLTVYWEKIEKNNITNKNILIIKMCIVWDKYEELKENDLPLDLHNLRYFSYIEIKEGVLPLNLHTLHLFH